MSNPYVLYELAQVKEQEYMREALQAAAVRAARAERGPSHSRRLLAKVFRGRAPASAAAAASNGHPAAAQRSSEAAVEPC